MGRQHDRDYLEHILRAAEAIQRSAAGGRDRIVHAYMDIDPDLVWSVIEDELPALVQLAGTELGRSSD